MIGPRLTHLNEALIRVDLSVAELSLRPIDPSLAWDCRWELEALFEFPPEEFARVVSILSSEPQPTPEQRELWRSADLPAIQRDASIFGQRVRDWQQSVKRSEAARAPTYTVREPQNRECWCAVRRHFQPLSGRDVLFPEIVEGAFRVKKEVLSADEFDSFYNAYLE